DGCGRRDTVHGATRDGASAGDSVCSRAVARGIPCRLDRTGGGRCSTVLARRGVKHMTDFNRDRREFLLQGSSLLLGAAALGSANADDKQARVRVAVVGAGARGSDLVRALTTIERAHLVAVCDDYVPHLTRGHKYAGEKAKAFTNFAKMLKEASPQAMVVAVPLHLHFEMCRDALDAGCDVFCE